MPDAGGEGVCVRRRAMLDAASGTQSELPPLPSRPGLITTGDAHEGYGFCTEFVVEADADVDAAGLREVASSFGTSVVAVADGPEARVHVHTERPEELLAAAAQFGRTIRVKVEDMDAQHVRCRGTGSGAGARMALVAVSRGRGFDAIFESLGARVIDLGTAEKPAAGEIAAVVDATGAPDVIVLPNHPNVLLAAEQAGPLPRATVHVVPTRSLPEGIAAAMAWTPENGPGELTGRMLEAARRTRTVEVTMAAALRRADGIVVQAGDAIVLADGHRGRRATPPSRQARQRSDRRQTVATGSPAGATDAGTDDGRATAVVL